MSKITHELIPNGSYALRIFNDADKPLESDIAAVMVLFCRSDEICEAGLAHGNINNEVNIGIGLEAYLLGFKHLLFHTLKDKKVTRWAKFISSDETYNYYGIDLEAAVAGYMEGKY